MSEIVSIVNQKGGVGKTTTAVNLAAFLAYFSHNVLFVDLDPQCNGTSGLGISHKDLDYSVYDALIGKIDIKEAILGDKEHKLKILPSSPDLAGFNIEFANLEGKESRLKDILNPIKENFDFIIIDPPPSLGLLTINSLCAASNVIIPVQAEYYALEGLSQLLYTINLVKNNLNPQLEILGVLITMFDKRTSLSDAIMQELYKFFPNKIFRTVIPRNVRLAEAPSYGEPILNYDYSSSGAKAYERFTLEFLEKISKEFK